MVCCTAKNTPSHLSFHLSIYFIYLISSHLELQHLQPVCGPGVSHQFEMTGDPALQISVASLDSSAGGPGTITRCSDAESKNSELLTSTSSTISFLEMFHSCARPTRGPLSSSTTFSPRLARAAARKMPRVPPHTATSNCAFDGRRVSTSETNRGAGPAAAPSCSLKETAEFIVQGFGFYPLL